MATVSPLPVSGLAAHYANCSVFSYPETCLLSFVRCMNQVKAKPRGSHCHGWSSAKLTSPLALFNDYTCRNKVQRHSIHQAEDCRKLHQAK
ncbi:hypothetical protein GQ55_9G035100 [Panicum hallii var. hallii]|uniref:Uncharacterized protein n=1 Tax=Panicum hallii var. hallii TaxID=1504633 RepID=A0A2T7BZ89_9POAL|nr:hypothetical protein GQ55_9G035100 [Panicum hallii var. hallii]